MAVRKKLGDLLIEAGAIDDLQLKAALSHQRQWGGRVGRILVEMRFVQEQQICDAVARQLGIPSVRLLGRAIEPALLELVPQELCEKHWVFPLALVRGDRGDKLQVAMSDPTNLAIVDELRFRTGKHIEVAVAPDSQIDAAIRRHFYGETVADQRPKPGGLIADIQFGGQEVDLSEPSFPPAPAFVPAAPTSPGGPRPGPAFAPAPSGTPGSPLPGPGAVRDELDALLGLGDPTTPGAGVHGSDALDAARRALFAAPGGLPPEVDAGGPSGFHAAAWAAASAPLPPAGASSGKAAVPPPPPGWPPAWTPISGGVPAPATAEHVADPVWGEPELLEEVDVGLDEAPLVVGTLIETDDPPSGTEDLELDPSVSEPLEPAEALDPLDPLADEAGLVAALESMAAGHEDPIPPGRLVAALALALIRRGVLPGAELLEELRR